MANPALGRIKHHSANQLSVDINEILGYLKKGYLLRMRGETSKQVSRRSTIDLRPQKAFWSLGHRLGTNS